MWMFWTEKRKAHFKKKIGNIYWGYQGSNFKSNKQYNLTKMKEREVPTSYNKNSSQREPSKWWECGEPQYFKYCHVRRKTLKSLHTIQ